MRKRARTDLCGGRSAMVVPTATAIPICHPVGEPSQVVKYSRHTNDPHHYPLYLTRIQRPERID